MEKLVKIFGRKVRHYRKQKGISQEELAAASELHRTFIGAIERGERNVSLNTIEKIANALNVPAIELLKDCEGTDVI